ncbi:MAG: class I SAM-dependent methyltransferase [Planctomycetota bacterium]
MWSLAVTSLLVTMVIQGAPGSSRAQVPLMQALDADNDGALSPVEIENASAALKKLDRNSDGQLTPDEVGARPPAVGGDPADLQGPPLAKTDAEKAVLDVLDQMDRNQRRGMMNVPVDDGRLLRLLTEAIGAKHVVELGTSNGYSGVWICLGLRATGGKLTTYEIDAQRAALARQNFKRAGVDGLVTLVEGDAHEEVTKLEGTIDLVFLDADKQGYLDYLEKLLPRVRSGGLILAHNMRMPAADPRYVKAVTSDANLETLFLNMHAAGMGVTLKKH